ncbi:hypothetical protein MMC30_008685 [Trapelia coarctata]|nr:hypothetical protein [Trapelia coarctata]
MAGRTIHNRWEQVFIHTAKCDLCEHHNKSTLYRCLDCKLSICTPCKENDLGDGIHYMNNGGRGPSATPNAPLLWPTPPDTSSAPSLQREGAEPSQNERQRIVPRAGRKRRRNVVEETDDNFEADMEKIPNDSRKGKKRQKPLQFETRTSQSKRRRADARSAVQPEKKRTVNFEVGESSRQAIERTQPEGVSRRAANQAPDGFPDFASTLLGVGLFGQDYLPALQTRNSTPDEQNLHILAMAAAQLAEAEDTGDEERQTDHVQVQDSETDEGQDAQVQTPLFFTEDDDGVDLEPQVAAPLPDSNDAEDAPKSSEDQLLTEDSPGAAPQDLVDEAVDDVTTTMTQELSDGAAFELVDNGASIDYTASWVQRLHAVRFSQVLESQCGAG